LRKVENKYFSVAHLSRLRGFGDGFDNLVDLFLKAEADGYLFLFPERKLMNEQFKSVDTTDFQVFLSRSGRDRDIVDLVFDQLQRAEVGAWYDKYEIQAGDSITERINEGLAQCDLGILFLSRSFLDPRSGWTKAEMNYFFHDRMKSRKKSFLCINVDLAHDEIPPLLRDYRYISWEDSSALKQIVDAVRRSSNDHNL